MKKKVLIISGTRADFGLLEPIILSLKKSTKIDTLLLLTGMHTLKKYGYTADGIKSRGYKISKIVPVSENGNMLSWLQEEIEGIYNFCSTNTIDFILVLGDRDEMLAGAIVGAHLGIPIGHVHGGDLSGESVVDSKNRNAITQFASLHFAATKKSAERISKMIQSDINIYVVGAPSVDFIKKIKPKTRKYVARKFNLDQNKKWVLIIMHPTPLSKNITFLEQITPLCGAFNDNTYEIIWIYPNSDTGSEIFIKAINGFVQKKEVKLYNNLLREDFITFLSVVDVLVGNSSAGIIESTYFQLPVVNIGDRQSGREKSSNVFDCGYNSAIIKKSIQKVLGTDFKKRCLKVKPLYGDGHTGEKISSILESNL